MEVATVKNKVQGEVGALAAGRKAFVVPLEVPGDKQDYGEITRPLTKTDNLLYVPRRMAQQVGIRPPAAYMGFDTVGGFAFLCADYGAAMNRVHVDPKRNPRVTGDMLAQVMPTGRGRRYKVRVNGSRIEIRPA